MVKRKAAVILSDTDSEQELDKKKSKKQKVIQEKDKSSNKKKTKSNIIESNEGSNTSDKFPTKRRPSTIILDSDEETEKNTVKSKKNVKKVPLHSDEDLEEEQPKLSKRRKYQKMEVDSDEEFDNKKEKSTGKKRSNKKDLKSDDERNSTKKLVQKSQPKHKRKETTVVLNSDSEDGSPTKGGKKQLSLEQAFRVGSKKTPSPKNKKSGGKNSQPVQSNTLLRYFSGAPQPTKTVVSVEDFFGKASSSDPVGKAGTSKTSEVKKEVPKTTTINLDDSDEEIPPTPLDTKSPIKSKRLVSPVHPVLHLDEAELPTSPVRTKAKKKVTESKEDTAKSIKSINTQPTKCIVNTTTNQSHPESFESAITSISPSKMSKPPVSQSKVSESPVSQSKISESHVSQSMVIESPVSQSKVSESPVTPVRKSKTAVEKSITTPTCQSQQRTVSKSDKRTNDLDRNINLSSPIGSKISPEGAKENTSPARTPTGKGVLSTTPHRSGGPPSATKRDSFIAYKQREGPRQLGTKEVPEGYPNCLVGVTVVVTGILESLEREDVQRLVERCGGKVTKTISKKTSFLVVGREPGESKINKADQLKTKQLDEDGFFDMVRVKAAEREAKDPSPAPPPVASPYFKTSSPSALTAKPVFVAKATGGLSSSATPSRNASESSLLWVDKYRPTSMKQLVGQHGPQSCANKLLKWLTDWHKKLSDGSKAKAYGGGFSRFGSDDGSSFRAALLSGPPGIGKTTSAQVVCGQLSFTYVEMNASDKRSKNTLQEEVAEALKMHSMVDLFSNSGTKPTGKELGKHHCLIMDEVDGMAGNEDRGGMAQLIQLIKTTRIPIICLCNDRQSIKIRSLANYCLDLRFQRPRAEQIKAAVLSLACKEGVQVPPGALTDIISASNSDMRQIINNLEMWSATNMTEDQTRKDAVAAQKDIVMGPFDVIRKVFWPDSKATLNDKSDLFFQDYSLGPLFVQENYLQVRPHAAQGDPHKTLELVSRAADSIALGDLVSKKIRERNEWGLLPTQAMFSSVIPGHHLHGPLSAQVQFPTWLGKNSSQSKTARQLALLASHMRLSPSQGGCYPLSLATDYAAALARAVTGPLARGEVHESLAVLETYQLQRDDMDTLLEVSTWPNTRDWMAGVESKTKAALTRAYNKSSHLTPYALQTTVKRGRGGAEELTEDGEEAAEDNVEEEEETDDLDAMIVKKKPKKEPAPSKSKKAATSEASKTSKAKTSAPSKKKKK